MSPHNSRHGTTCSISSRNTCRRVFFVYRSKPFIVARLLCCLFVDLIWRTLLYLPVERETLFRLSLDCGGCVLLVLAPGEAGPQGNRVDERILVDSVVQRLISFRLLSKYCRYTNNPSGQPGPSLDSWCKRVYVNCRKIEPIRACLLKSLQSSCEHSR